MARIPLSLIDRNPEPTVEQLLSDLVPPREFEKASFKNYLPHSEYPSQAEALRAASNFALGKTESKGFFSKRESSSIGIYLDGGFGVGKTHLLASTFNAFKGIKAFGSFISFTSLIGALTFPKALSALSKYELICIDEFELDDPGDTMMMSRLLNELSAKGVKFAATSNTPPNALGEGRFAAEDFQREIHGISDQFKMIRIDGEDHRHRPVDVTSGIFDEVQIEKWLQAGKNPARDDFDQLLKHLARIHPSKYGMLLHGLDRLALDRVHVLKDQAVALRFVSFVDRAYEQQVNIRGTGIETTKVFTPEQIAGGYSKKYLRAISRLGALAG